MVQFANPHQQQPRDQYGRPYPQQQPTYPQPPQQQQPPLGSVMTGGDGRPYQLTQQGWMLMPDPRQQQQLQYPQPMAPAYPQQPMQPQYPVYQAPNQPSQMPSYAPQNVPQPTVYPNPNQRPANRFGGNGQPVEDTRSTQVSTQQPQHATPVQQPPQGDTSMQLVSNKTSIRKNILSAPSFKIATRTTNFNEVNAVKFEDLIVSDCLDELVEAAIEKTVNHDRSPAALIAVAVLEMNYHKANQKKFADDLFQPDIKAIYKAFKTHLASVNNRYDLVYLSAINDYLTELVNDTLYPILDTYPMVDSFMEDFNDLLRQVRNSCSAEVEDLLIENVNAVLERTQMNFSIIDKINEVPAEEGEVSEPVIQRALIPIPVQVICLNYLGVELGNQANLARMLSGLTDMITSPVAYVCTIDKTVYKAFFGGERVILDLLRD